ncbi:MAG: NmrA family transcriptional regulator, partial [Calditrichaeota bacterium]
EPGHVGEVYEVTGPRLMSFADIAADLSAVLGHEVKYIDIPHDDFLREMKDSGAPKDVIWLLDYLFATVLDGRNAYTADGIQRALGRPPKDFTDYARETAKTENWKGVTP